MLWVYGIVGADTMGSRKVNDKAPFALLVTLGYHAKGANLKAC